MSLTNPAQSVSSAKIGIKAIPKGFRSHESARRRSPEPQPAFFVRKQSRSPRRDETKEPETKAEARSADPFTVSNLDEAYIQYEKMISLMRTPPGSPDRVTPASTPSASSAARLSTDRKTSDPEPRPTVRATSPNSDSGRTAYKECIDGGDLDLTTEAEMCPHHNVEKQSGTIVCLDCAVELYQEISYHDETRYFGDHDAKPTTRGHYTKKSETGICKDLEKLGFDPDVALLANQLFMEVTKGEMKKSDLRKGIEAVCTFEAHKILGRIRTPEQIQSKFPDLEKKNMSHGLQYFALHCPREYFQYEDITPSHFVPQIMKMPQFRANKEHIDRVVMLCDRIYDRCPILDRSNPQSVAKAIFYYYLRAKKCRIDPATYGRIVSLSEPILLRLSGEVSRMMGTNKTLDLS